MFSITKILLLSFILGISVASAAQNPKEVKAAAEAKARETAEAEAKAKEQQRIKEMLERRMKAEGSNKRISESAAAAVNAKAEAFYSKAMSQINTKHIVWIKEYAKKISDKNLDELSVKVMANYYGKKEGLSEMDIEGVTVLLVREAYKIGNKEYQDHAGPMEDAENKKMKLLEIREMLLDEEVQISQEQLDSINRIINEQQVEQGKQEKNSAKAMEESAKPDQAAKKAPAGSASVADLSLTKKKLVEKIELFDDMFKDEAKRMQEIKAHQQKMTYMLSTMVNDVAESQDSIIQRLK